MSDKKPIYVHISNPRDSILKKKATDKAFCDVIFCSNSENCDLFKLGGCSYVPVIGWNACPYGSFKKESGPTKKSTKCNSWCAEKKELYKDVKDGIGWPKDILAFVGDYVYVPYAHADSNEAVPFLKHSRFFSSGNCFIPKVSWNLETIQKIIDYRPQALMGGEITSYQKKEVPLFLKHLAGLDKENYKELLNKRPEYIEKYGLNIINHIGRKARLLTLKYPIKFKTTPSKDEYIVEWQWDGKVLKTNSRHSYSNTFGQVKAKGLELTVIPDENTEITIQDNDWVTEETIFVD